MTNQKYYVVWNGRKTGIFNSWAEASAQVTGFPNAQYKSFESRAAAEKAFQSDYAEYKGKHIPNLSQKRLLEIGRPITDSYSVDAACNGSSGLLEYRGLHTTTKKLLFKQGPFQHGTNNVGEFLAIVHALALLQQREMPQPIYSDSETAITWVKKKKCNTDLPPDEQNRPLFDLIARAETWLNENTYENRVLKWDTEAWGEIPADYGRK
ncbi:MAG TPA: ribonuclease H family protein [Anaerolineaceae bacterium]|nr:ribonuclease H family protein [Anaerolineaceae bacterium]